MNALILVDLQNDFLPGGALAVPQGDAVIPVANRSIASAIRPHRRHAGLASRRITELCGESSGAAAWTSRSISTACRRRCGRCIACRRRRARNSRRRSAASGWTALFRKARIRRSTATAASSTTAHRKATGLADYLRSKDVTDVFICGLATDYCVKFTALDAVQLGFRTSLIEDACRGVNLKPTDSRDAIEAMRRAGVNVIRSDDVFTSERRVRTSRAATTLRAAERQRRCGFVRSPHPPRGGPMHPRIAPSCLSITGMLLSIATNRPPARRSPRRVGRHARRRLARTRCLDDQRQKSNRHSRSSRPLVRDSNGSLNWSMVRLARRRPDRQIQRNGIPLRPRRREEDQRRAVRRGIQDRREDLRSAAGNMMARPGPDDLPDARAAGTRRRTRLRRRRRRGRRRGRAPARLAPRRSTRATSTTRC